MVYTVSKGLRGGTFESGRTENEEERKELAKESLQKGGSTVVKGIVLE